MSQDDKVEWYILMYQCRDDDLLRRLLPRKKVESRVVEPKQIEGEVKK